MKVNCRNCAYLARAAEEEPELFGYCHRHSAGLGTYSAWGGWPQVLKISESRGQAFCGEGEVGFPVERLERDAPS